MRNIKTLTLASMLAGMSVAIGILCKNFMTFGVYYRFTLENLPVVYAGLTLGPVPGMLVGITADIASCLLSATPALNPIITVGAAAVGALSGLVPRYVYKTPGSSQIVATVAIAHFVGQVCVKSVGKIIAFGMPVWGVFIGLGLDIVASAIETVFLRALTIRTKGQNDRRAVQKEK